MSSSIDEVSNESSKVCSSDSGASSKKMSTSCDQKMKDGICENISCITNTTSSIDAVSNDINNMNISDNNVSTGAADSTPVCANCGKEGLDVKNICNKCKLVKYCNASCKKKHRSKHKKDCEEIILLAAKQAAELHDVELFKQPPQQEDCPICFLRMPLFIGSGSTMIRYYSCCGKDICGGCHYALNGLKKGSIPLCPYCRTPDYTSKEEQIKRNKKRVEAGDAYAIYDLGCCYRDGEDRYPRDRAKAFELFVRAGELGYALAYCNIGYAYEHGTRGVKVDKKKSTHYYELAAMGGNETARYNLAVTEQNAGNMNRALKHHMIAVRSGYTESLDRIQELYSYGDATRDEYAKALQLYQAYLGEVKSAQRDEAVKSDEEYRYY